VGRHSSDHQLRFYRSVAGWFLPWALVAAVAATAMWIAVDAIGQEDLDARPPASREEPRSPSPRESPSPTPEPTPRTEAGGGNNQGAEQGDKQDKPEGNDRPPAEEPPPLITSGVSVQVLNGTSSATAGGTMAARLRDLGFGIAAIGGAARPYERTTVFWSTEEDRPAAQRLASRFGWVAALRPANLSPAVDIHIVVGADEA
jgi:LytR cell envelope-related transcriptional attenuator